MFNNYAYLYVEDDPMSREIMQITLQDVMGVSDLVMFADSQNIMDRVHALSTAPDVIFLDIHIEPYSGIEILQMLKEDTAYEQSKIIAVTASVMNEEIETLKQSGFDGAIGKPIDVRKFPALVEQILNGKWVWEVT